MIVVYPFMKAIDPILRYVLRVLSTISQVINVALFFGHNPAETLSGRCYRLRSKGRYLKPWRVMQVCIDFIFIPFHVEHCKSSHETSLSHAFSVIDDTPSKGAVL